MVAQSSQAPGPQRWPGKALLGLLVAAVLLGTVAALVLLILTWGVEGGAALTNPAPALGFLGGNVAFLLVGAIILWRRPGNLIGVLCLAIAVVGLEVTLGRYLAYTLLNGSGTPLPVLRAGASVLENVWIAQACCFLLLMIVFPTGRPASKAMGYAARVLPLVSIGLIVVGAVKPGLLAEPFEQYPNSTGIAGFSLSEELSVVLIASFVLTGLIVAGDTVRRFKRSSGVERLQFKWFALAACVIPALMLLWGFLALLVPDSLPVLDGAVSFAKIGVAVAIGIAILRHRLYDIDLLIHRTLVYGSLSAILAVLYAGLVVALQTAISPLHGSSDLAIALTTLVVAALFLPLRQRVQMAVDRRFNRRTYDAARTLEAFSARLRDRIDLTVLQQELTMVVNETMQPSSVHLWLKTPRPRVDVEKNLT